MPPVPVPRSPFKNPMAGPILVGKLGWHDLYRMRLWVRVLRPLRAARRRGGGGLLPTRGGTLAHSARPRRRWRADCSTGATVSLRDGSHLNWRYVDAEDYRVFESAHGYAVVGHKVHKGVSAR